MSSCTSPSGRLQFSQEKAKRVRRSRPRSFEARTTVRTASTPLRWPSARGSPRRVAQRPLPSMMMATWPGRMGDSGLVMKLFGFRNAGVQTVRISFSLASTI